MWLAPNLITLMASACIMVAYALNLYYLPGFTGEPGGGLGGSEHGHMQGGGICHPSPKLHRRMADARLVD